MENDTAVYYRNRDRFNTLLKTSEANSSEAAALFYYLNRTGYNGLCRFNNSGGFNVPFGRYRSIDYRHDFSLHQELFATFHFMSVDFEKISLEPDDFVYADPPYDVEFTQYSQGGFDWDSQVRVAQWLKRHPGPVILSNQATDRIMDLYLDLGYVLHTLQAPRLISCTGDRSRVLEVLAVRNL